MIVEVLDALDAGQSGLMLHVAGEPGIGKSRLQRQLSEVAGARGHLVVAGRAAEFEGELPFGVFIDLGRLRSGLRDPPDDRPLAA